MGFTASLMPVYGFYMYGPAFMSVTTKYGPVVSDFEDIDEDDIVSDRATSVQKYLRALTPEYAKVIIVQCPHDVAEHLQKKFNTAKASFVLIGVSCVDTANDLINSGYADIRRYDETDFTIGHYEGNNTAQQIRATLDLHENVGKRRFSGIDWEYFFSSGEYPLTEAIKGAECHYAMDDCICCS